VVEKMTIEEVLLEQGIYVGPTVGFSMLPMLKARRDTVIIVKKEGKLSPLDVALYKRSDGAYILHRVLEVTDTGYIIRGDNCYVDEIVEESTVLGVLREFYQKDKHILCTDEEYLKYVEKRLKTYPRRRRWVMLKRKIRRILSKIKRTLKKVFCAKKKEEK
jgi:hypothetical protein